MAVPQDNYCESLSRIRNDIRAKLELSELDMEQARQEWNNLTALRLGETDANSRGILAGRQFEARSRIDALVRLVFQLRERLDQIENDKIIHGCPV